MHSERYEVATSGGRPLAMHLQLVNAGPRPITFLALRGTDPLFCAARWDQGRWRFFPLCYSECDYQECNVEPGRFADLYVPRPVDSTSLRIGIPVQSFPKIGFLEEAVLAWGDKP